MSLQQILMKRYIFTKFGMINQAMMLFFVGMKKTNKDKTKTRKTKTAKHRNMVKGRKR